MSDIGPHEANTSFEIIYNRPSGPPIEVDIEISGICYCDDPEWGIEARDITARIVGRELTDEEIEYLDLEQPLTESFFESQPCSPRAGEFFKCSEDGFVWKVVDVCLTWGGQRDRFVLLERPKFNLDVLSHPRRPTIRRLVPLTEFDSGVNTTGEPLFQWTRNEKIKPGNLRAPGEAV